MKKYFLLVLLFILINQIISQPKCINSQNHCIKCNPITNLCSLCEKSEILTPDENGGCQGKNNCLVGKNYCLICDINDEFCQKCDEGFYPDENGGCSYTNFCKYSYKGECIECKDNYILVGEIYNFKLCKSKNSDDFLNCEKIDAIKGVCEKCEEGYYLNKGDKKCIKIENCKESIFGNCITCITGYYYNKKIDKCIEKTDNLIFCKQTLDDQKCDICDDYHYFDENGICTPTNYCSISINGTCIKCRNGFYLTPNSLCSETDNCFYSDKDTGICSTCDSHFYLDTKDYQCKSNLENNEFKYCTRVENDICSNCEWKYYLGKDLKCSSTMYCAESGNGKCNLCLENYYLGLDNNCIDVENCLYSNNRECIECSKGLYYNRKLKKCLEQKDWEQFKYCKISNLEGTLCAECEKDFYLRKNDSNCFLNTNKDSLYKCAYSDVSGEFCEQYIKGYFLGREDKKCSLIEDCAISEDENKCIKCSSLFCYDVNKNACIDNEKIWDENIKIYFKCNKTNELGNKCEECVDGFEVGEEGYCINTDKCEEMEDGICLRCKGDSDGYLKYYCSNNIFGCVQTINRNCLRCDNITDFNNCTECKEGFSKTFYGACEKEKNK